MTAPVTSVGFTNPDGSAASVNLSVGQDFTINAGTTVASVPLVLDYEYTPAPPAPTVLVGTDAIAVTPDLGRYSRRFNGANLPNLDALPLSVTAHPSVAALPTQAVLYAWLDRQAAAGRTGYFTYKHEVNTGKKGTPDQFIADMNTLADMMAGHPHGDDWPLVEVFGLYAEVHHVAKNLPPASKYRSGRAKYTGWDCYPDQPTTAYTQAKTFLAPVLDTLDLICEVGCVPIPTDPTGSGLADWYMGILDFARSLKRVRAVAAWNEIGTNNPTQLILTGTPLWAWRRAMAIQ